MKIIITEKQANEIAKLLNESKSEIEKELKKVNTDPSEAQKKAGNYKMGHITFSGFEISIENPKGSYRKYKNEDGTDGKNLMKNHYGYFTNTMGKDGDQIDVFLGNNEDSDSVFVVDQNNDKKEFDESKVMLGFNTKSEAKKAYMNNYNKNWKGFRNITEINIEDFRKWLYSGKKQRKPFSDYSIVNK